MVAEKDVRFRVTPSGVGRPTHSRGVHRWGVDAPARCVGEDDAVALLELVAWIVGAYGAFVAGAGALALWRKLDRPQALDQFAWMLTFLALVLALLSLARLGPHPSSTHIGYLGAVTVVMPYGIVTVRHDRSPWSSGVIAVCALATAVVAWRIIVTA